MNELTPEQEDILAQCLHAMEEGQGLEACLARFPQHAHALRPLLHLHAELLETDVPEPSAAAYQAGREALLGRLADERDRRPVPAVAGGLIFGRLGPALAALAARARDWASRGAISARKPAVPGLAVAALVLLVGGGALGASAAAGFEPAQTVLSSLGMMEHPDDKDGQHVEDGPKDSGQLPTAEPNDEKTPVSVIAPPTPTADKPDEPAPTDKPAATPRPTRQPDDPEPTDEPLPPVVIGPTPIPIDLGVCIPESAYNFYTRLQRYAVKLCSEDEVAWLHQTFAKGLCLPKEVADLYPPLAAYPIRPCTPKEEEVLEQYMFVKGWCVPDKVAYLLANLGYNVPACTTDKLADIIKWYLDNDPCGLDWNTASTEPPTVPPVCPN